ncbi:hypothetical protein LTR78_009265 [Recurvomyces mirabilis]|uniref:Uncharacterized protein n=1 Tax=Recurvomyces mirabilis TaxID=574656 RepID=A0AAE0WFF0_9PEZI|nr:hypothetical protein LTR78_009265 [Recurvomyces mirabilis]KAK5156174.1 hypothetical protein LTS14_005061 [Recurvomyces mirabilis]
MPAAVVKGIIISISIITALGIAVLENPQLQAWLEEQRQKIVVLLRSLGEELDPESRRQAEAFAYEGRTPATDDGLRREASGSRDAAALATGRRLSGASNTVRRISVRGPNEDEAEERRRKGREYLARRNRQMIEMQERRKIVYNDGLVTPSSPTSFDQMVNEEGSLRGNTTASGTETPLEILSPRPFPSVPASVQGQMEQAERQLDQAIMEEATPTTSRAFLAGALFANPFSDEFELDRSETPRPRVPPKIAIEEDAEMTDALAIPGSFNTPIEVSSHAPEEGNEELTYEEQLAIALSLSEAESSNSATVRQGRAAGEHDDELQAAIEASLREMDSNQAAHAISTEQPLTPRPRAVQPQPLVDLTPPSPRAAPVQPEVRRDWEALFDPACAPSEVAVAFNESAPSEASDELYRVTPELTRARLASFDAQQREQAPNSDITDARYDPVREAAGSHTLSPEPRPTMESSFYSAPSSISHVPSSSNTLDREPEVIEAEAIPTGAHTPTTHTLRSDSDSDTFASLSRPESRAPSHAPSEVSSIEIVDLEEDSDVDMLSEEGNGVSTPDSWTEVGSRDGESEAGDLEQSQRARVSL